MDDPDFHEALDRYRREIPDRVQVEFAAQVLGGKQKWYLGEYNFIRQGVVPAAAIERSKRDADFGYKLISAITLHYREEMMEWARQQGGQFLKCHSCRAQPVSTMLQVPIGGFRSHHRPHTVQDNGAILLCGAAACQETAREYFRASHGGVSVETFRETETRPIDNLQRCFGCGLMAESHFRCSRCREVYFCDRDCQKRGWKEHKNDCRPPPDWLDDVLKDIPS